MANSNIQVRSTCEHVNLIDLCLNRSIHDNFRAVQLACRFLNTRKIPAVLLKLDIEKAFDSVGWPFLIDVMLQIGFPRRWIDWQASTKVILNGRPGDRITHARALRQGDPLSPMIVMEALNSIIREADRREALSPLPGQVIHHRASLYADDLVMFLAPVPEDLTCLRRILDAFVGASGLITNLEKCVISPIHCSDTMISEVQQIFTCTLPVQIFGNPIVAA
jgi:hypothetical protein